MKKLSTLLLIVFLGIILLSGSFSCVLAQGAGGGNPVTILNHLQWNSLEDLMSGLIGMILMIVLPIAMIIFIWTAVKLIRAGAEGNEQKITEAKKALIWAFAGLAVLVMAEGLLLIVKNYFLN